MPTPRLDALQQMPVFGALRSETLEFLLGLARERHVAAGECFVREGDPAESMFVLERGSVSILRRWQGRDWRLHGLAEGDCFGEMALMDLSPRSATVRADTDCQALELSAGHLLQLFEHDAEQFALVQMNIGREVCRRLRATDDALFRAWMGERPDEWPTAGGPPGPVVPVG